MTTRWGKYPKDDDWGDWAYEARKAKALDKRWAEELDRALANFHDDRDTCQRCGRKTPRCGCGTPDEPTEHPDTGWGV